MKKDIDKKLKELFDFQKFEENPKLSQTIKDSLKGDTSIISDMELSNVTGAGFGVLTDKTCPNCKQQGTYYKIVNPIGHNVLYFCKSCGFSELLNK